MITAILAAATVTCAWPPVMSAGPITPSTPGCIRAATLLCAKTLAATDVAYTSCMVRLPDGKGRPTEYWFKRPKAPTIVICTWPPRAAQTATALSPACQPTKALCAPSWPCPAKPLRQESP